MRAKGISGKLTIAGRVAAVLSNWDLKTEAGRGHITARATEVNEYWIEHCTSFDVRLSLGAQEWRWKAGEVDVTGNEIQIWVEGNPEVTNA